MTHCQYFPVSIEKNMISRSYIAIDLKSFYALAECADRKKP